MPARLQHVYWLESFDLPLPEGHRFPMEKYTLLARRVLESGLVSGGLLAPPAASDEELSLAHDPGYVARMAGGRLDRREMRPIGFPWSPALVERARRSVGATIAAGRAALEAGIAVSLAGGTHHAHRDRGAGYCVFNDSAVAARVLTAQGSIGRAAVLDCDVHQGDGTAAIAAGDPSIFTMSIHGARNYPFRKAASDLDVALEDGTTDEPYLAALEAALGESLDRGRPDLAFYVSGADPFAGDRLGRLALTKAGLAERDRLVLSACRAAGVPVVVTMAGGYGRDVRDTVDIHFETVRAAAAS